LRLLREIADALSYAHSRGILHRDVKPENILIQGDHALLADFGVAKALDGATGDTKLTGTGMGVGTVRYMAPEQMLPGDAAPDARSDVYALGIVAYEVLTGATPFVSATPRDGVVAQLTTEAPPVIRTRSDVPRKASDAIARSLAFAFEERLESAAAFRDALVDPSSAPEHGGSAALRGWTRVLSFGALAALLIIVALLIARTRSHASAVTPQPAVTAAAQANAIAVLPFANLTPAANNQFFSDGMTEELITALSRVPGLRVLARTSAFAFQGKETNLAEVSAKLHVGTVVEGSVRRMKNRLRVSARLVDTQSGYQLWSEEYDRDLQDVFEVQDDIARAIAGAIRGRLDSTISSVGNEANESSGHLVQRGRLVTRSTRSIDAYDKYLRARAMRELRGELALRGAVNLLSAAIREDTAFADAYAALALTYLILTDYSTISQDSVNPLIRANAMRALALNPQAVEAEIALSGLASSAWQWRDAETHIRRAIDLDPSSAMAHLHYADLLRSEGRFDASLAEHHRATELDPLSGPIAWNLGITLWNARRYGPATQAAERAAQLSPNLPNAYLTLAVSLVGAGKADSAARLIDRLRAQFPQSYNYALEAWVYGMAHRTTDAERVLMQMRQQRMDNEVTALEMAMAHLGLGRADSALKWIEQSIQKGESDWSGDFSACGSVFDPVRSEPRFRVAILKLGLSACGGSVQ
ncbi:MAG TPA: protein kinase, partial [Gemmatimonadaceae bacterium]